MSLLDELLADEASAPVVDVEKLSRLAWEKKPQWEGQIVRAPTGSQELDRILAIPRRPVPDKQTLEDMVNVMTARLSRYNPACECARLRPEVVARGQNPCITTLRTLQAWYLFEASHVGGAVGSIKVGGGKTGIDILTAMVAPFKPRADGQSPLTVLLIPPSLRSQFMLDYQVWSQHFKVPNLVGGNGLVTPGRPRLEVLAYSELSHEKCAVWLSTRKPDAIIADEAQSLGDATSVRTGRFLKYMEQHRGTMFFCHSGSISTRSVEQFQHLSALSLGWNSPLPVDPRVARVWAAAIDPVKKGAFRPSAGALSVFCQRAANGNLEDVRIGFSRRLLETAGFISTAEEDISTGLSISEWSTPAVPKKVREALKKVRELAERPDGEPLVDALSVAAVCRQLAAGFYYKWVFPRATDEDMVEGGLIDQWFARRKDWFCELRGELQSRHEGMDSPKLLRDAAIRYWRGYRGVKPIWQADTWPAWAAIRDKVYKEQRTVWVDDYLARAAAEWAQERPGIVWYTHGAFGLRVAKLGHLARFGAGADEITLERGDRSVVASLKAHGTGKNLQAFHRALFPNTMMDAGAWEQGLGRMHRFGQPADVVTAEVALHTTEMLEAFETALERARYARDLLGSPQKLLYGELIGIQQKRVA